MRASRETGAPIITHAGGDDGPEQAELLVREVADPGRVMIGHMDGNTDVAYHLETLSHGVNIAFDRFGIQGLVGAPMDEMRTACLLGLLGMGYGDRILLSHDTVNVWLGRPPVFPEEATELLKNWHATHLFDNVVPVLREANVPDALIESIFTENPRKLFDSRTATETREAAAAASK